MQDSILFERGLIAAQIAILPRIPPQRWRLGALADWNGLVAELSWRRVDDQDDIRCWEN
jgi:hypothetical protein